MSRSSIFDVVKITAAHQIVELDKTLDDGKPVAIKVRPLVAGDLLALNHPIPVPSGRRSDEWEPDEKLQWYEFIKRLIPNVVVSARHVAKSSVQANGEPAHFDESWIPLHVITEGEPNRERNEITIAELESLGTNTLWTIGSKVLVDQDKGGEMTTLPEMGDEFRVGREPAGAPGVDGEAIVDDAARAAVQP